MLEVIGLVLTAILAENMVLVRCLGLSWAKDVEQTEGEAWRMGVSLTMVMVMTALASWLVNAYVLRFFAVEQFRLLAYALVVLLVVAALRGVMRLFFPVLYRHLADHLSRTVSNCAVLGVAFFITLRNYSLPQTLLYALASGVGVLVVQVIFAGLQDQASFDNCPGWFRGIPIRLLTVGLMAMALMGFYGLHMTW